MPPPGDLRIPDHPQTHIVEALSAMVKKDELAAEFLLHRDREPGPAVQRITTFDEVTGGLDESTALFEARRCMSCGNCFGCDNCYGVCPDNAIINLGNGQYEIDYDYCKGCGLCVAECPCGSIEMEPEPA